MREIKLNREIKFRGQQINTKQWIYGYLYRNKGLYVICENIRYAEEEPILLDTVGQFTGIYDINGTEIYEGDIVEFNFDYAKRGRAKGVVKFGEYSHSKCDEYDCSHYGYYVDYKWGSYCENTGYDLYDASDSCQVIGNIYDNSELLKEE